MVKARWEETLEEYGGEWEGEERLIRCDKTFSELWNLTESKDNLVAEAAHMAIKTIKEFQEENRKQQQEIGRYKSLIVSTNANGLEKRVESERSWFANQTELIEEKHKLKQEIEQLKTAVTDLNNDLFHERTKNDQLRSTLEFYADEEDYWGHGEAIILSDGGAVARRALGNTR